MLQSQVTSDLFFIRVESRQKIACVKLTLKYEYLSVQSDAEEDVKIQYRDIFSCQSNKLPDQYFQLQINFMSVQKSGFLFKSTSRKVQSLNLITSIPLKCTFWRGIIKSCMTLHRFDFQPNLIPKEQIPNDISTVEFPNEPQLYSEYPLEESKDIEKSVISFEPSQGKYLVFINPASGKGLAQQKWQQALLILGKTGHSFRLINTEYSGHCRDFILKIDQEELLGFKGIILVSGDGLPHEAINGMFTRPDWSKVKDIPVGVLPGGSGNAFAKNICVASETETSNEDNAFIIAKGCTKMVDLMLFETNEGKRVFSFLSLAWSFIADVDLESEKMRFLGETRFTVYGTWRAIFQKKYPGILYYTKDKISDEIINQLVDNPPDRLFPDLSTKISDQKTNFEWNGGVEKQFKYFLITKQPYISENYHASPLCKMDDGMMDIQYLYEEDGWSQLISLALNQDSGNHIDSRTKQVKRGSRCKYEKVSAFRLCPTSHRGRFSIDGEQYVSQDIQGIVLSKFLKVFCM